MADVDIIETRMLFEGFGGYGESKVHAGGPERLDVEFRSGAENQVRGAMDALNQMLLRKWPVGSACEVMLNSRQKTPTPAIVIRASSHNVGFIRVQLQAGKNYERFGNGEFVDVHWRNVVSD